MLNEPRIYRRSPLQIGLAFLVFGVVGFALLTTISSLGYLFLIPLAGLFGIIFLILLYSMTTKTTISDSEISTQTILGAKSLTWNEISRVSGWGNAIKLHNNFGDVTVAPNQQLPGYEEVVEWIGTKRPDLFNPLEYSEMSKGWVNMIYLPLMGLLIMGMGLFVLTQSNDTFVPFIIMVAIGVVFFVSALAAPQSLTLDGKSLLIKYMFNQKTLLADEIRSVELKYQSTRNGRVYFIMLNLINQRSMRISGLRPSLPIVYLVLKNWHKKNAPSGLTT